MAFLSGHYVVFVTAIIKQPFSIPDWKRSDESQEFSGRANPPRAVAKPCQGSPPCAVAGDGRWDAFIRNAAAWLTLRHISPGR